MPKVELLNIKGEKLKDIKLEDSIWSIEPNDSVIYDAVILAQAAIRQGSHSTKTRAEVSGGGRKPWKQKGTGNARQGSIRSPQWKGGGIVFGPTPEKNYTKKMNKKERKLAVKSALSYKLLNSNLVALDSLLLDSEKTKGMLEVMKNLKLNNSTLFVTNDLSDNLILASRNIRGIKIVMPNEINTLDLVTYDKLVITEDAVKTIEEVLA